MHSKYVYLVLLISCAGFLIIIAIGAARQHRRLLREAGGPRPV